MRSSTTNRSIAGAAATPTPQHEVINAVIELKNSVPYTGALAFGIPAQFNFDSTHTMEDCDQIFRYEGRRAAREFDVRLYLGRYPDLRAAFGNDYAAAITHFVARGLPKEGRRGSAEFDVTFYINHYPDLQNAFGMNFQKALPRNSS
jgi:hypothetical protein